MQTERIPICARCKAPLHNDSKGLSHCPICRSSFINSKQTWTASDLKLKNPLDYLRKKARPDGQKSLGMLKVIYIAGPFNGPTTWDREQNIRNAETIGLVVAKMGAMPLVPHAMNRFYFGQMPESFWYAGDLELLYRSDAMLIQGQWEHSDGTRNEIIACEEWGIPYFYKLPELGLWLNKVAPAKFPWEKDE